jgi:hypothetical protein
MADFALFAVACERGAVEPARFLAAYTDNQSGAQERALEDSYLPAVLVAMMENRSLWTGTAKELLDELTKHTTDPPPKEWPKRPNALTGKLRRLAPALRRVHRLDVDCDGRTSDRKRTRVVTITRKPDTAGDSPSTSSRPSETLESQHSERTLTLQPDCPPISANRPKPACADDPHPTPDNAPPTRPSAKNPWNLRTPDDVDDTDDEPRNSSYADEERYERLEREGINEFGGG